MAMNQVQCSKHPEKGKFFVVLANRSQLKLQDGACVLRPFYYFFDLHSAAVSFVMA